MDFVDGPSNDVVRVYIDGVLVHTGTSWENYYRYDPEAISDQTQRVCNLAQPGDELRDIIADATAALSSEPMRGGAVPDRARR